jgi:hypothetical protein
MDRRMLAIGAAAIALAAVGCGADADTERAIQAPDVEAESAVPAQNGGNSGGSDAAQGNSTQPQTGSTRCWHDAMQPRDCRYSEGVEQQRRYYEGTRHYEGTRPHHLP